MTEKHLHRKDEKDESDEESHHVTEGGPKLKSFDPMDVISRSIVFGKEVSNAPKEAVIKEKSEQFKDQMSNTNQYMKFINAHLAARKSKVEKIKEAGRRFNEEIEALQDGHVKPRAELEKVNSKYITENDTRSLLSHLETERDVLKEKFVHQEQQIETTRQQILQKDEQILGIKNELETLVKKNVTAPEDPISIIKKELARLGIKDDSAKILEAINSLSSLVNTKK